MKTLSTTMLCAAVACVAISPAQAGKKNCCPPPTACYQCQAGTTQASPQMAGCRFPLSYTDALSRAEDATKAEAANKQLLAQLASLKDQLAATKDLTRVETIDLSLLAPRKIDWDLKRDVEKKLDKLERKTQRVIAELIRRFPRSPQSFPLDDVIYRRRFDLEIDI